MTQQHMQLARVMGYPHYLPVWGVNFNHKGKNMQATIKICNTFQNNLFLWDKHPKLLLMTSLVVQWLRICLLMQGMQIRSQDGELRSHKLPSTATTMPTRAMKTQHSQKKIVAYKIKDHNKPNLGQSLLVIEDIVGGWQRNHLIFLLTPFKTG